MMRSQTCLCNSGETGAEYAGDDANLGIAWGAILTGAVSLYQGLKADKDDPIRIQRNSDALALAQQGNQNAIEYLKFRTGKYGEGMVGAPYNEIVAGWKTPVGRKDAETKYAQALALYGLGPQVPGDVTGPQPLPGGPAQGLPLVPVTAKQSYLPLLVLGGLGAGYYLYKRRRR